MSVGDYFEIGMILAFGISWPINLIKAWRARTTRGTSLLFLTALVRADRVFLQPDYGGAEHCRVFHEPEDRQKH